MIIEHNMMASNANRNKGIASIMQTKAMEKLSSGLRINKAGDDAAGLSISEKMRSQIRGLSQNARNIEDGISYVQTADGALQEVQSMLHRLKELSVEAANDTNTLFDRVAAQSEVEQLKNEIDSIFETTTFNDRKIWKFDDDIVKNIGTEKVQTVKFTGPYSSTQDITQANKGVIAVNGYKVNATEGDGVWLTWTGYNGNSYETKKIDWTTLANNNYSFEMSDYFKPEKTELFNNGSPVLKNTITFAPDKNAEISDIAAAINGCVMSTSEMIYPYLRFEDAGSKNGICSTSIRIDYSAAYAADMNFDTEDNDFIQAYDNGPNISIIPAGGSVDEAKASSTNWQIDFKMTNIGKVTATSCGVQYYSYTETSGSDENIWWEWRDNGDGTKDRCTKYYNVGSGTLGDVMKTLTGKKAVDGKPGLLNFGNGGESETGGYIELNFLLTSQSAYTYADGRSTNQVGSMQIIVNVEETDTEQSVLDKINNALNSSTILDAGISNGSSDRNYTYRAGESGHKIDIPVQAADLKVQAGPNKGQFIEIIYERMNVQSLGLSDISVRTIQEASDSIDKIADALKLVNSQRSKFGAYQNRLEHAANYVLNASENTQSAESRIRDADYAREVMNFTKEKILDDISNAMIKQSNEMPQSIINLMEKWQ